MRNLPATGHLVGLSLAACLLASCQMSTNDPAVSGERLLPPPLPQQPLPAAHRPTGPLAAAKPETGTPGGSLTLEAAVREAIRTHPLVDEATGRLLRADELVRAAEAGYYPKVRAGLDSGYGSRNRDGWRPRFSLTASQMLYDFGKVSSAVEAERAGGRVDRARLLLTIDKLARDTAGAVIEVQRYRALADLAAAQVEGVRSIAALVQERSQKGASTMSDKIQADARVQSALATEWQYRSELDRWRSVLSSLMGREAPDPAAGVPAWLENACAAAPSGGDDAPAILEASARKAEAEARLAASRAAAYPTVSLEASTAYDLNQDRDRRYGKVDQPEYAVGLKVSSDLYNGGATSARHRAAAHALQAAEASLRAARRDTERGLVEARSQIGALNRLATSLGERSDLMARTRDLYRKQYMELGTRTLLDLLNAEQELFESRFQIANTVHDLRRLNIGCLFSAGRLRAAFGIDLPPSTAEASTR